MISTNSRTKDLDDVGLLFHAILRYAEANNDRLDCTVVGVGYGVLLEYADRAAAAIAEQHVDEGEDWDGCVWLGRLADIGPQSLAESLFIQGMETESADVPAIVKDWLATIA
uniref:Uncharacterized protein n=2 Tax=Pseudomonas fluorescens TaxID=294 RepID=A0A0G4E5J8_PSEFS|nr:hypothetical protein PQBR57_0299 [Pseudomonas fluorescens SBW25]